MQPGSLRFADLADVACLANHRAQSFAWAGTALALVVAVIAWWSRPRVAALGQQTLWALAACLAAVMHVLCAMFFVPSGCLSGHLFSELVGAASPWLLAAGLFRTGVAPAPPALDAGAPAESSHP